MEFIDLLFAVGIFLIVIGMYSAFSLVNLSISKTKEELNNKNFPEAIYFKRKTLKKDLNTYHHIGVYCYEMGTLKDFVSYKQSPNEAKYKLEQLRALENKIKINVALAKSHSIGIDTKEDFVAIKKIMEYKT